MAEKEPTRRRLRRSRRTSGFGPEFHFTPVPILQEYLPSFSLPVCFTEAQQLFDLQQSMLQEQQERARSGLQGVLRPLDGICLPGIEALKEHLRYKYRRGCKPNTLHGTIAGGKMFLRFLEKQGKEKIEQVSREDLEAFVEHEQDRGMKPQTVRSHLAVIRAFLAHLANEGVIDYRILLRPLRIKLPDPLPRAMAAEDVKVLTDAVEDIRARAMILVLLRTGMRIGELLDTKMCDVHLKERRIDIPQASKNATGRVVYLSEDSRQALGAWFKIRDEEKTFVFYSACRPQLGYAAARAIFRKQLARAGLQNKGYGLHQLRHTFATEMLNAGMRLECLQQLLGHTSVNVTRRYARLTDVTRETEYFQTMEIIKRGGAIHGNYQLDSELQAFLEEKKLLAAHTESLPERSETVSSLGRRSDRTGRKGEDRTVHRASSQREQEAQND
jgi:integrase/recombinase XerD